MSLAARRVGGACWRPLSAAAVRRRSRVERTRYARTVSVAIEHDGSGHTTWMRLNAPASRNALSADMVEALVDGLDAATHHGSNLLVLTGEGVAFSGGFDLSGLSTQTDADLLHRFVRVEQFLQQLNNLPMTTVALVQGRCVGAAADAVACCHHRIASPDATFRFPGLRFGLVLGTRRCVEHRFIVVVLNFTCFFFRIVLVLVLVLVVAAAVVVVVLLLLLLRCCCRRYMHRGNVAVVIILASSPG
jgi:hypothetical protein